MIRKISNRGCRDNILLLRVLYDQVINKNASCIVTYIDYTAAFDSVSHKFLDATLASAKASTKSRAIFRTIYDAACGVARVRSTDGKCIFSEKFNVGRGVIQGDVMSPVLFILAPDQLIQKYDTSDRGPRFGRILRLKVLGYADDAALIDTTVQKMSHRLTMIADKSKSEADMIVNVDKTFTQHVHRRESISVTETEVRKAEKSHAHKCDFCERRFKTRRGMLIHNPSRKLHL